MGRRHQELSPQKTKESTINDHAENRSPHHPPDAFGYTDLLWRVDDIEFLRYSSS